MAVDLEIIEGASIAVTNSMSIFYSSYTRTSFLW